MSLPPPSHPQPNPRLTPTRDMAMSRLFLLWLSFGVQSFGGGSATLALIRRAAVDQHRWLSEAEFAQEWGLCQIAPGINLLALTLLIGKRVAGTRGIFLALIGLLLPSVTLTILLTALYSYFRDQEIVRAALRGIVPATIGLGAATACQMALALLRQAGTEGKVSIFFSLMLLLLSILAAALWHPSVILILVSVGGMSALLQWLRQRNSAETREA